MGREKGEEKKEKKKRRGENEKSASKGNFDFVQSQPNQ